LPAGRGTTSIRHALVATSTDCGKTFGKPIGVSNPLKANSGSNLAIDP
jgi:hypothetical protein